MLVGCLVISDPVTNNFNLRHRQLLPCLLRDFWKHNKWYRIKVSSSRGLFTFLIFNKKTRSFESFESRVLAMTRVLLHKALYFPFLWRPCAQASANSHRQPEQCVGFLGSQIPEWCPTKSRKWHCLGKGPELSLVSKCWLEVIVVVSLGLSLNTACSASLDPNRHWQLDVLLCWR